MNYATHRISLDIHKSESQAVIEMKRADTGRKIKISLTEDGKPYKLTSDCSAVFKAKKPDGHDIKVDCDIDGNVIIYTVSLQTTTMLGEVECEIMLYNESGMLITSPRFVIIVSDTVQSEGSIADSDSEASTKVDELLKNKAKSAVDEYFEENPITGISDEQAKNINDNSAARHSHENTLVLDKFGVNYANSRPTFDDIVLASQNDVTSRVAEHRLEVLQLISAIPKFAILVVDSLPTENISNATIYLVRESEMDGNLYTEYVYINNIWECLGSQKVDLTGYATKKELEEAIDGVNGSTIIKVMSFPVFDNSDIQTGYITNDVIGFIYDSEDPTKNPLPENSVIIDVGIVLNDDTEIRRNQMWQSNAFNGALIEICNTSMYDKTYMFPVFRAISINTDDVNTPLFNTIMNDGYKHLNVYYI